MPDFLTPRAAEMDIQQKNYSELNLAKYSRRQQVKGSSSPPEKLIAVILGVLCFILMYTIVRVLHFIPSTVILEQSRLPPITKMIPSYLERAYYCGRCPPEWFTISNNCYYIFTENKTWKESLMACASKNSGLLYIDNEEEMKFLISILPPSWTGVFRNSSDQPWAWIDGSTSKLNVAELSSGEGNCAVLTQYGLTSWICESTKAYICKHKL